MALVNGGHLRYTDMKKFLKILLLCNCQSDFEIIVREILIHKKYSCHEWGLLALYRQEEILRNYCFQSFITSKKLRMVL